MQQMIRTTLSGFLGFFIAIALFMLMLSFLTPAQFKTSNNDTNMAFNFVKSLPETIKPDKPDRPQPPEMQKTSTPPAMPAIDVADNDAGLVRLPPGKIDAKSIELYKDLTAIGTGIGKPHISSGSGGVKAGIAPMYPRKALMSQTEGWVEVLVKVNATGQVTAVSVLNAEPRGVFDQAARQAVRKWQFYPKLVNGQAVPYQVVQKIEFTLDQ